MNRENLSPGPSEVPSG